MKSCFSSVFSQMTLLAALCFVLCSLQLSVSGAPSAAASGSHRNSNSNNNIMNNNNNNVNGGFDDNREAVGSSLLNVLAAEHHGAAAAAVNDDQDDQEGENDFQQEINLIKDICISLVNSEGWSDISESIKEACFLVLYSRNKQQPLQHPIGPRERRFFSINVGKNAPLSQNENSNKGFKYGK